MDPGIHPSEGHRSDVLLDLSGLPREERVMDRLQSVTKATLTELPKPSSSNIARSHHLRDRQRRAKGDGFKRIQTLVGFRRKVNTLAAENLERTSVQDYDYFDEDKMNLQTPIKPTMPQLTLEAMTKKKLWTMMITRKKTRFLRMLPWMMLLFSRQLNWTRLLFLADTWNDDIDPDVSAHLVQSECTKLTFSQERTKKGVKAKPKVRARADILFDRHICRWRTVDGD